RCLERAWRSGSPGSLHYHPVWALVHDQRGHSGGRRPEPGNLPLQLDWVGTAGPGRRDSQFAGINIAEDRRHIWDVAQKSPSLTTSPPRVVHRAFQVLLLIVFLIKTTWPSHMAALTPPG